MDVPMIIDDQGAEWLYAPSEDGLARYILGTPGRNPLVCLGLNPSTARPGDLDRTVRRVEGLAAELEHDSFIMLNVYPERETHPRNLGQIGNDVWTRENKDFIAAVIEGQEFTMWAAWGWFVDKRPYLLPALRELLDIPELANCTWVMRGKPTKRRHPHHPLYVKNGTPFAPFDVAAYCSVLDDS